MNVIKNDEENVHRLNSFISGSIFIFIAGMLSAEITVGWICLLRLIANRVEALPRGKSLPFSTSFYQLQFVGLRRLTWFSFPIQR